MDVESKKWCDRFIPARINSDVAYFNLVHSVNILSESEIEDEEESDKVEPEFVNTALKAFNIAAYKHMILDAIGIHHSKILRQPFKLSKSSCKPYGESTPSWPVYARKKPLISKPETILDMPNIDEVDIVSYRHLMDWGKNGDIATIFLGELHLYSFESGQKTSTQMNNTLSLCVKFDSSGERLAVSRCQNLMSILDAKTLKVIITIKCKCIWCYITTLQWTNSGSLIMGCSRGAITLLPYGTGMPQFMPYEFQGAIADLKVSCNDTYYLASTLTGDIFIGGPLIDEFPSSRSVIPSTKLIRSTAWHPWDDSILAVGELNNRITIHNVKTRKVIDSNIVHPYFKSPDDCKLDCLTFNPLSGELVVSFYYENPKNHNNGYNILTVFKNLSTRVDEVRYHLGRVPHVAWDGTGTQLASLGIDENLVVWNFFGKISKTEAWKKEIENKNASKARKFPIPKFKECIR
ncbi:protein cortex [Euwallacea similis]|uniref:protein cortex n=1 Tax=Euwallacea similis TaxID=1736056 RepID=UPI0034501C1C